MKRLAKNFILATATVSAIFFVDPSSALCCEKNYSFNINMPPIFHVDFWSKFRDTVMPDKPQDNNPPKEMRKPKPSDRFHHRKHKPRK